MTTRCIPRIVHSMLFLIFAAGCDDEVGMKTECYMDKSYHSADHSAWTQYYYNTEKKLTSSIYISTAGTDSSQLMTFTYDANGNVTSTSDGGGGTTSFSYNDKNEMIESVRTSGGVTYNKNLYEYNPSGQLITVTYIPKSPPGESPPITVITYAYSNTTTNNPSSYTVTTDNVIVGQVHSMEYDNNPNPDPHKLLFPRSIPDNNLLKETVEIPAPKQTYTYYYRYNRHGYPDAFESGGPDMITYICE